MFNRWITGYRFYRGYRTKLSYGIEQTTIVKFAWLPTIISEKNGIVLIMFSYYLKQVKPPEFCALNGEDTEIGAKWRVW